MSWSTVKLGDICTIEKGQTGIQKAIPGSYPLVVTSEERKSHNEFQFDDEAVIIPLVSGTGHGHASIKRIHYQTGKFALGSILCAVIPKDKTILNPEYLFRFLELNKENELVARMRGMANVTLPMKEIAKIEIPLPPLKEQIAFVNSYKILAEKNSLLLEEFIEQLSIIKQLRQSFLREAMEGKLVKSKQFAGQETGLQLLEKIKTERAKLVAVKRLKKEKELSPVKDDEIPFEIPEHWVWCKLGDLIELTSGQDLSPSEYSDTKSLGFPYITGASNLQNGEVVVNRWTETPKSLAIMGDLLLTCKGSGIGKMAYLKIENAHIARQIMSIRSPFIKLKYIEIILLNNIEQFRINAKSLIPGIDRPQVFKILFPLPPLQEQRQIAAKLNELMAFCNDLEQSVKESQVYNDKLLQQVLSEALQPKEETVLDINSLFDDKNYNLHVAMIQTLIESQLGINHGEVANQKTIFHINTFTNEKIPYQFVNYHFGTFSQQLRDDLNKNPYLTKTRKNNKDVFIVKPSKQKEVLDSIYKPENKSFVTAVKEILDIYQLPSINKETDKIELLNTVSKLIIDLRSTDLDIIYQGMKDWKIIQKGSTCKADKFSKAETEKMIRLIRNKGLDDRMLSK